MELILTDSEPLQIYLGISMTYAKIENDIITVTSKPKWFNNSGQPLSDEELKEHGYLPVEYNPPTYDPAVETLELKPNSEWVIETDKVVATYQVTPIPLSDLQERKRSEINSILLSKIDGGFEHNGHFYDSDTRSVANINGTATGASAGVPLPADFTWRAKDNVNVPMDAAGIIALGASLLKHINTQYSISWELKTQIDAATSPAELDAITWPE